MNELGPGAPIPKVVLGEPVSRPAELLASALARYNPIGVLVAALTGSGEEAKDALRSLLRALIEEGRRFEATPAGRRWASILADSPAVDRGWLLWSHSNLDLLLRNATMLPDSPGVVLEAILRQLATIDMAQLMSELNRQGIELDSAKRASRGTRS